MIFFDVLQIFENFYLFSWETQSNDIAYRINFSILVKNGILALYIKTILMLIPISPFAQIAHILNFLTMHLCKKINEYFYVRKEFSVKNHILNFLLYNSQFHLSKTHLKNGLVKKKDYFAICVQFKEILPRVQQKQQIFHYFLSFLAF